MIWPVIQFLLVMPLRIAFGLYDKTKPTKVSVIYSLVFCAVAYPVLLQYHQPYFLPSVLVTLFANLLRPRLTPLLLIVLVVQLLLSVLIGVNTLLVLLTVIYVYFVKDKK